MYDHQDMNGQEFIRKVRKLGRKAGIVVTVDSNRGKGGHQTLYYGVRLTTVKTGEIAPPLLRAMCRQIGIDPADL